AFATIKPVEEKVTLEWTFTPEDFFEAPCEHKSERCTFEINDGKVAADASAVEESEFGKIHEELEGLFLGAQLFDHKPYTLSDFAIIRTRPEGFRSISISVS